MTDHEKPQADEEFQSGEVSEEDLADVVAAGTSYNVTVVNHSDDEDNSKVKIFHK